MQAPAKNTVGDGGRDTENLITSNTQRSHEVDELRYKMNNVKRGRFIIINNEEFHQDTKLGLRNGSSVDRDNLEKTFRDILGFEVVVKNNLTNFEMLQLMIAESGYDHSACDCFGVAVLTHGEDGKLYGTNGLLSIESFVSPIKNCRSLAGKPKLFFIQACRGDKFDEGVKVKVEADSIDGEANVPSIQGQTEILLPLEADFLYAYSTVPGYFAWRNNSKGSWFVQALTAKLDYLGCTNIDLVRILTRVNHEVAYDFQSKSNNPAYNEKKEVPSIVSMLTKDLYFTRK